MLEALTSFLADYGYLNLFVLSFLASTILPLGSEALIIALIYQGFNPFAVVMVATSGNFLGSCTTYYLGLKGRPVLEKYLSPPPEKLEKSEKFFKKYGLYTLLFTWVPGIGDVITMVAGLMKLPFRYFSVMVFLGKFGRYFAVAYLTAFFSN
ncbi:membrane protein YqaA, SNARE-associated domain [Methanosarcina thermophila]|jgi:membrane protein YqaA with SNARE-associated domain|nr:YqaA family protein [Methanosarcina thermophila]ALK05726.1 MAG: membrane protein [Methanosarcina sp. 795]AKB16559.1 SNARE associated Golgi protein [Methanosarcina thermophila CHTI-55]NLU56841.1 DedA family protein [Methanosarcina thermophila]SFT42054.1 membrane protein YqaA, SNARE-associated domain [Methanosarcina thermophila]BAW30561.1 membrane protein [Methanosarcina thermophila]